MIWTHLMKHRFPLRDQGQYMDFVSIPIGFVRFSVGMGWKWVGINGKGYANTTYISEFHPRIPAGRILKKKKRLQTAAARQPFFVEKSGRPECGDGIRRCRLCSHILCRQCQPIPSIVCLKIEQILSEPVHKQYNCSSWALF